MAFYRNGYFSELYEGKKVYSHRLIWFRHYGYWPKRLDHINRIKTDNRIENLREASTYQSSQNRKGYSGYPVKCVGFDDSRGSENKYRVRIRANGKAHHIGWYPTRTEAETAAIAAIKNLHGAFSIY